MYKNNRYKHVSMHPIIQKIIEYIKYFFFLIQLLYDKPKLQMQISPEKEFYEKELGKFKIYESTDKKDLCIKNENIEAIYYDIKKYNSIFQELDNPHETLWKRRILYMTTPVGNVAMYYDPYKMGFSYYADQYISYNILNAVAMRYVRIYQCMDFFMDEIIAKTASPLIDVHKKELSKIQTLTSKTFVRPRNAQSHGIKNYKPPPITTCRNTFILLGKMRNLSFTQCIKHCQKQLPKFTSNLLQNIDSHPNRLSYKDFIKTMHANN